MNGSLVEDYKKTPKDATMKRSRSRRCKELELEELRRRIEELENKKIGDVGAIEIQN
jgi:hypothetical protein